jgi:N-acetylglucosamine-6-phosphate deacetylase
VVRLAWRALGPGRLNLVTDAVAGAMRNAAGILAGSSLSLDQAVRNLVAFTGCAVADAIATVTSTPADLLGLAGRGRLVPGARADVSVLDGDLRVVETYVGGELAWRS